MKTIFLIITMIVLVGMLSGCETAKGAANGFSQDAQNTGKNLAKLTDPDKNGWHALQKADAWMQKNLW